MYWIPIACFTSFGFAQLFKWSQRRGCYAPAVVFTNYLVLASVLGAYLAWSGQLELSADVIKVGVITGSAFVISMLIMTGALEVADVASVLTSFRMSIILPILLAVWLWRETAAPVQILGIGLALLALFLMTRNPGGNHRLNGARALGVLILIFCCQGLAHTCMRWVHYAGLSADLLKVLLVIGLTAGTLGALFTTLRGRRPAPSDFLMGGGIGVYNAGALTITLTALSHAPGTIFFPIVGCAVVLLDNLTAHFFWKEPLNRTAAAGAALAVVAILLVIG